MEVREIEWFVTLARLQSVTVAANELHISQPTLSRALARLERRLGVNLFDRHQNRLRLNKYGEIFEAYAIRATQELTLGREKIATLIDPERGTVSLGFLHSFGGWLIPPIIDGYHGLSPSVAFELEGGSADSVADGVRDGRIDIGFVAPKPVAPDLAWVPLGSEELCLEVPSGDPWEGRESISIAEISQRPMLALGQEFGLRKEVERLYASAGFETNVVIEATELSTLRAMVKHGGGIAIIPVPPTGYAHSSRRIPINDPGAFREYGVLTQENGPVSMAAQRLLEFVLKNWGELSIDERNSWPLSPVHLNTARESLSVANQVQNGQGSQVIP